MLRLSVGIEDAEDIVADLQQGIEAATDGAGGTPASADADGTESPTGEDPDSTPE
jgi:hypothetical protein